MPARNPCRKLFSRFRFFPCHKPAGHQGGFQSVPPSPHPAPDAISAFHKKSCRPPETAKSRHRSIHTSANAPPPTPPLHEIPSTRAVGETAQSLPDSALLFPH